MANSFPTLTPPANAGQISNPSSIIWNNYLDLQHDVLPYLQAQTMSADRQVLVQLVTDYVCQLSQQLRGGPIAPMSFFARYDGWSGWNGAYLMLDYAPVLNVAQVAEWWGTSGPNYLSESTPEAQVWGYQLEARIGMLTRVFPGNVQMPWFPGSRSIEVTWTAGYNPVPAMFKIPALEIIAEWWQETQQSSRSAPSPAGGGGILTMATDTYPGLPVRCKAAFGATQQVGIG